MDREMKTCNECGEPKTLEEFYRYSPAASRKMKDKNARVGRCKACYHKRTRANWAALSPAEKTHRRRVKHYQRKYGITPEEYEEMRSTQKGRCAICGEIGQESGYDRLRVDHDHETGMVRALICLNCNTVLGHAKDNPEVLKQAIAYLEKHAAFKRLKWAVK